MGARIRSRLVGGRVDAKLVFLDHAAVFVVGGDPDLGQPVQVIVPALDRILVDQPVGRDLAGGRAERQDAKMQHAVGQEVVPGVRIIKEQQRRVRLTVLISFGISLNFVRDKVVSIDLAVICYFRHTAATVKFSRPCW